MDELIPKAMQTWWGLLLMMAGLGVIGLAQVRPWESREEALQVVGFAMVLMAVAFLFLIGGVR